MPHAAPVALVLLLLVGSATLVPGIAHADPLAPRIELVKRLMPTLHADAGPSSPSSLDLVYGGGTIQAVPRVYLVFWGFSNPALDDPSGEASYLTAFFAGIGGSDWASVHTQYYSTGPTTYVTNPAVQFNAATDVWYDTSVADLPGVLPDVLLAQEALRAATHFGYSANANYVIATPHGRNTAGFAVPTPIGVPDAGYCAWHSAVSSSAEPVAFTNLPYQTDAPLGVCGANIVNPGAAGRLDGVSIVAGHEYTEAVTDPVPLSGWADADGWENADKCAWRTSGPGRMQNIVLSTGTFAVQGAWSNADHDCAVSYGYHALTGGPYLADAGSARAIAATSTGGTGADSCTWSGAGATFGSSTSCSTTVTYATAGSKTLSLSMTDSASPPHTATATTTVTVAAALAADAGGPYSGAAYAAIAIAGTHTGGTSPYACAWSGSGATFGNAGSCSTTVSYSSAGSKTVTLVVTDGVAAVRTDTATVTVSSIPLAASPGGPYSGALATALAIAGTGMGGTGPYTCSWSSPGATFGSATACSTTVAYASTGSKTLTLTVTDSLSATATASTTVTVTEHCAADVFGDQTLAQAEALHLSDLTSVCLRTTPTHVEATLRTGGMAIANTLGTAVDPVTYRVMLTGRAEGWEAHRVLGQWVVLDRNTGALSAATVTVGATDVTLRIPLAETGSPTGGYVETAWAGDPLAATTLADRAPNAGWLAF